MEVILIEDDKPILLVGSGNNGKTCLIQELIHEYPGGADRIFETNSMDKDINYQNIHPCH